MISRFEITDTLITPKKPGWNYWGSDHPCFVTKSSVCAEISHLYPDSIKSREDFYADWSEYSIMQNVQAFASTNWSIGFLVCYRLASLIASVLKILSHLPRTVVIVKCMEHSSEDKVSALLNTTFYSSITSVALNSNQTKLTVAMESTNDGICLLRDTSLAENMHSLQASLDRLLVFTNQATLNQNESANLIALISRYAGDIFPSDLSCVLDVENVLDHYSVEKISELMRSLDAVD